MFENVAFGWNVWDIGALILLALIVIVFSVHVYNQKKRARDFENQISDKMREDVSANTHTSL